MKSWLKTALIVVLAVAAGASTQAQPPAPEPIPVPAPSFSKDGPFRLLAVAKVDARNRRAQGFRADVVKEGAEWYVICYR